MALETAAPSPNPHPRKIVRWYTGAAILLLNTLLLFVLINLLCWGVLEIHKRRSRPDYLTYSDSWYRNIYPSMSDSQWKELLREIKDRPFGYQPYTMVTETPYQGTYVNISDQGYRLIPQQGPWPLDPKNYNVLAFGGSSMFGYAVADDQTISAYMQPILQKSEGRRVCVYNFGQRACFSTQERILFEQLLRDGAKPNLVVFVDGLNDFLFAVEPTPLQQTQADLLAPQNQGSGHHLLEIWKSLPAGQMAQLLSKKILHPKPPPLADWSTVDPVAIDRYVWNKKAIEAICDSLGIAKAFIYQPAPIYHHGLTLKEADWDTPGDQWVIHGYPLMAQYIKDHDMGKDFLWLADMQQGIQTRLYVDKWHYTPEFAKQVAGEICNFLEKQKDIPTPQSAANAN
jgi:hypothetical protein